MSAVQLSNPRKRRRLGWLTTPQQYRCCQHKIESTEHTSPGEFQPSTAFWDKLSKIELTRRALEELDRRNSEAGSNSQPFCPCSHQPLTEPEKSSQPLTSAARFLCYCGASDLKDIKQSSRHGGPDLSDLRGIPEPPNSAMDSDLTNAGAPKRKGKSPPTTPRSSKRSKSTGPYDRNFQQNLIDGGIYPSEYRYPESDGRVSAEPSNWVDIHRRLSRARASLSPGKFTEDAHKKFETAVADAAKERQVSTSVIPLIEGDVGDAQCVSGGIPFTNLLPLTEAALVTGNPDIYYGARPEQLDRRVRDMLSRSIIPSSQGDLPIAPNFFLAAKDPDGSAAVAKRQACYDGALGARGMLRLRSYGQEHTSYNEAYTISSIYHDGTLKLFTSHPTQPINPEEQPEYHMHQLRSFAMTDTAATFRQGATHYRNARDWAKEQRNEAIRQANGRVNGTSAGPSVIDASAAQASGLINEATADEVQANEVT